MPLKTDYKNFIPSTTTKIFDIKQASDDTVINADVKFEDVTVYSQEGDSFGSADINATNAQVNANTDDILLKAPLSNVESGWLAILATLTYASADSPTFVANTSIDLTDRISVGMKIKLTQTTVKYFFVTAITTTTITLYGGTDYTLADETITYPHFSLVKSPLGFPLNPTKWSVVVWDSGTIRQQADATNDTWYELTTATRISIPIGLWIPTYIVKGQLNASVDTPATVWVTLSTASASQSTALNTASINGASTANGCSQYFEKELLPIELASKTTYYLNTKGAVSSGTITIYNRADDMATIIRFVCAYL